MTSYDNIKTYKLNELKTVLKNNSEGILFCFGTSFISRLIQFKTRLNQNEIVPSHVALIIDGFIYESTTDGVRLGHKHIPSGVRRWYLKDFYKAEKKKDTTYYFISYKLNEITLEKFVHYPYGIDTIIDFALKDGSNGVSKGLICSQYANNVCKILDKECPSPAELYRVCVKNVI